MKYQTYTFNPVQENTYLLWDETTLEAAIVDAGTWNRQEEQLLEGSIAAHGLKLKYALQTHAHFDHTYGLPFIYRTYGVKPIFHVDDEETYRQMPKMAAQFGLIIGGPMPPIERLLNDGAQLSLGATTIRLIHTPGHTTGSASFYIPDAKLLFSGDTLFQQSIGRTDLPGGDYPTLIEKLKSRVLTLPDDYRVLPGHGIPSQIGKERKYNSFLI